MDLGARTGYRKHRGRSVIVAGRRQPAAVHALAAAMNLALGNVGTTVSYFEPLLNDGRTGTKGLVDVAQEIAAGKVDTLVITAANPAYSAPADLKFDKLLERVPNVVYLGLHEDETAAVSGTFVAASHPFETWSDLRGLDGTAMIVQPLIEPLFPTVGEADLLAAFAGDEGTPHDMLKAYWAKRAASKSLIDSLGFSAHWEHWLAKGIIDGTAAKPADALTLAGNASSALKSALSSAAGGTGMELAFAVDPRFGDGRAAHNVWLQELPHPVTKITWDNAVLLSHSTAGKLGLRKDDIVELTLAGRTVRGPVYVQPGQAEDSITVALGYGRTIKGSAVESVGFNAYALRASNAPWFAAGVEIKKVGSGYKFGITQDHWSMEGRDPVLVSTLEELHDHHSHFHEKLHHNQVVLTPEMNIHEPVDYSDEPYKWGMTIDLNKCTGCGACVVACQSENNIPVVGRDNVRIGREMHWLRIDRYYETDAPYGSKDWDDLDDPKVVVQPVACQHCETAPCEYVCPVNATVHSDEGLNEMVYNRCVGTRYCSNNCPYKARRFNFLDFHGDIPAVEQMKWNPDVTVRVRGVMEKCTFCVQRIERGRIDSRREGRKIAEGDVVTACQQSCPSDAIVFGNLNDPTSAVSKSAADERHYSLLNELNTRPRTLYLSRVRNPNPELA